jgi:PHD/YefM family antitoxin component YafN of YafNO toxin-antitoxin module
MVLPAIKSLTDFLRNSKDHISRLKETGSPQVLTINGEASIVIQDAKAYEEMASLAEMARQDERLKSALEYFREGGKGIPAQEVLDEARARFFGKGSGS